MGDVINLPTAPNGADDPHARMGPRGYALLNAPTVASPMEHYWAGYRDGRAADA